MPYGALVWIAGAGIGVPMAGLPRRPTSYPPEPHAASLDPHLVFGLTVEVVRRLLAPRR